LEEEEEEVDSPEFNIYDDLATDIWNRTDDGYEEPLF